MLNDPVKEDAFTECILDIFFAMLVIVSVIAAINVVIKGML